MILFVGFPWDIIIAISGGIFVAILAVKWLF